MAALSGGNGLQPTDAPDQGAMVNQQAEPCQAFSPGSRAARAGSPGRSDAEPVQTYARAMPWRRCGFQPKLGPKTGASPPRGGTSGQKGETLRARHSCPHRCSTFLSRSGSQLREVGEVFQACFGGWLDWFALYAFHVGWTWGDSECGAILPHKCPGIPDLRGYLQGV